MILPHFIIGGAAKGGTTTIYNYLAEHPKVFMPLHKEPYFFSFDSLDRSMDQDFAANIITDPTRYSALFRDATKDMILGEGSTSYLYTADFTIDKITRTYSSHNKRFPKLLFCLRNPVDRAFSHYMYLRRNLVEERQPHIALKPNINRELIRRRAWDFDYINYGFYSDRLAKYLLSELETKVYILEDLKNEKFNESICNYLNIEPRGPDSTRRRDNISGEPKNRTAVSLLTRNNILKSTAKIVIPSKYWRRVRLHRDRLLKSLLTPTTMPSEIRNELTKIFSTEIDRLEDLLERDLTAWRSV